MRGPRRSTQHHSSEMLLRSSLYKYSLTKTKLSLYASKCEVCNEKPAKYLCKMCNRYVCEDHYDRKKELCLVCLETLCDICRNSLAVGRCCKCGRKVCHNCLIELDEVHRLCYYCLISKNTNIKLYAIS